MPDSSRRIKVIHVIARMNVGGPALLIDSVHRLLDTGEVESILVTGEVDVDEIDYLSADRPRSGVRRLHGLGRAVRPLDDLRTLVGLVRLFRAERPDIVHTHTAKAGVLGRLAAVVARIPIRVHTYHGHVLSGYFRPVVTWSIVRLERVLARTSTALVAVGHRVRDDLLSAGIGRAEQFTVIAPGVSIRPSLDRRSARQRLGLPDDAPVVVYVGRLTAIKRPDRLIEAFRTVRRSITDARLIVVGGGELADQVASNVRDLGNSVELLGWRSDVHDIYPAADVVALSSDNEGMPVTLIEASCHGIPCVTTDVGSAGEVVIDGRTGFVTEISADALARGIEQILSDRDVASRFSAAARTRALDDFAETRMVDDHALLYRRLVEQRRARRSRL